MEVLQDNVQKEFLRMLASGHTDPSTSGTTAAANRLSRLLMRLLPLKTFVATTMEELFFAGLIGNVQIDNIIPYILRMETAEYNLHMAGQTLPTSAQSSMPATSLHDPSNATIITQLMAANMNGGSAR